jgi:putative phosphoesterase
VRLLVISDLHANWPALEAVVSAEPFDRLLVGGDLVSYGPHPRDVIDFVRAEAALTVRGNHDEALARGVDCGCAPASRPLAEATQSLHREMLSSAQISFLGSLPLTATFTAEGCTLSSVHATPRDCLYRYTLTPDAPEEDVRAEIEGVTADCLLVGHTHLPMIRRVGATFIVNPGSVGQPRDGDPRASYAIIEDGVPRLARVAYDVERTVRDLQDLPLARPVMDALVALLRTGTA